MSAGLHEKCSRAHGRVTDLERQNLLGRGIVPKLLEDRLQRRLHNGSGERTRRVVRTRSPPLIRRLEDHSALGDNARRDRRSNLPIEGGHQPIDVRRGFQRLSGLTGQLLVGLVGKPLAALVRRRAKKLFQIDRGGCAVPLDRLDGDGRARGNMKLEAHDGLVDAANLLDGKSAIADALAIEQHEL